MLLNMRKRGPILAAFAIALPGLYFVASALNKASFTTLGRDQGIFQYIAWAVRQGDVLYRDIRDVNGPVITMVHIVFQWLGGEDERRFRLLDLGTTGLSFLIAGWFVATKARWTERLAWSFAAWVALSAQYVVYTWWDTAQRESFLDWFVLVSVALVYACAETKTRRGAAMMLVAGACASIPCLGKPTFAMFAVVSFASLFFSPDRKRRVALFAVGGALGVVPPLVFLLAKCDAGAWIRISTHDVPAMYRFIWPRPASAILTMPGYNTTAILAVFTAIATSFMIVRRVLPARAIPVAAMPILGLVSMLVQAKGFPYHFHPITLGSTFAWIVMTASMRVRLPWVSIAGGALIGVHAALLCRTTYDPERPVPGETPDERLASFERVDFFPAQMRAAAALVAEQTRPDERVQMYGMDAYVLFLARRRSATPYIYAYDLNVDYALAGSYDEGGIHPTEEQKAIIRAMKDEHVADLVARIEAKPPAAFVFVSLSPLMTDPRARNDFADHCPKANAFLREHYTDLGGYPTDVWIPRANLDRP